MAGVTRVTAVNALPVLGDFGPIAITIDDRTVATGESTPMAVVTGARADAPTSLGVGLRGGRWWTEGSTNEAVISQTTALRYFDGADGAIGRHFSMQSGETRAVFQIVGVSTDVANTDRTNRAPARVWIPMSPETRRMAFIIEGQDPGALSAGVRSLAASVAPTVPIENLQRFTEAMRRAESSDYVIIATLGGFSLVALLLATAGLFGVVSYSVSQRTPEFGTRMALGASAGAVVGLVARQSGRLLAVGLAVGLAGGVAVGFAMRGMLFGTSPADPATLAGVSVLLIIVSLIATVKMSDTGQYTVVASNALGQARASARLEVGYVLTIKPQAGGEAARSLEREVYLPGTILNLTAKPAEGRQFLGWRGDVAGKANPLSITMDRHKQVAAKFEAFRGEILWDFPADFPWPSGITVDDDNTVFLSARGTNFVALDGDTGLLKWRFDAKNYVRSQAAVSNDGTLVFVADPNLVFALERATGKLKWRSSVAGNITSRPSIGPDGTVYVAHENNSLLRPSAFSGRTGARIWQYASGNGTFNGTSPAVSENGLVYVTSGCEWRATAIEAATGARRWSVILGGCAGSPPALGGDGTVYVESGDGILHALDGMTGAQRWKFALSSQGVFMPIVGKDETVYLLGSPSASVALDGHSGRIKAGFDVKSNLTIGWPTTAALAADGSLYAVAPDKLFALSSGSGDVAWSATLPPPNGGTVNIGPDSTIYVAASVNGETRLLAIRGTSALAYTPWPAAGGNEHNSGTAGDRSFRVMNIHATETNAQVLIRSRAGQTHQLEFKRSIEDREWTRAASVAGDGAEQILVDPTPPVDDRFYRVRVE
jgi:outer membrane protein assembly factor BamB